MVHVFGARLTRTAGFRLIVTRFDQSKAQRDQQILSHSLSYMSLVSRGLLGSQFHGFLCRVMYHTFARAPAVATFMFPFEQTGLPVCGSRFLSRSSCGQSRDRRRIGDTRVPRNVRKRHDTRYLMCISITLAFCVEAEMRMT